MSIEIGRIWDSYVFTYLVQLLSKNWKSIGLTTEIESRLGKITDSGFVPGVSQKFFSDMRNYLLSRDYWVDRSGKKQTPQEEDEYAIIFIVCESPIPMKSRSPRAKWMTMGRQRSTISRVVLCLDPLES